MERNDILKKCDHTLLDRTATWAEIKTVLDDAIKYGCASACIPPHFVKRAKEYVGERLAICTVIGFPNGYSTTTAKLAEASDAISDGADEIDTVVNVCQVKDGEYDDIRLELEAMKAVCQDKILKVIIETCLLTDEEKVAMCRVVSDAGADYIKTSTGFSHGGATFSDVELLRKNVAPCVKVKAAGGIKSFEDAERFISLGADRLGTSRLVKIIKGEEAGNY